MTFRRFFNLVCASGLFFSLHSPSQSEAGIPLSALWCAGPHAPACLTLHAATMIGGSLALKHGLESMENLEGDTLTSSFEMDGENSKTSEKSREDSTTDALRDESYFNYEFLGEIYPGGSILVSRSQLSQIECQKIFDNVESVSHSYAQSHFIAAEQLLSAVSIRPTENEALKTLFSTNWATSGHEGVLKVKTLGTIRIAAKLPRTAQLNLDVEALAHEIRAENHSCALQKL